MLQFPHVSMCEELRQNTGKTQRSSPSAGPNPPEQTLPHLLFLGCLALGGRF